MLIGDANSVISHRKYCIVLIDAGYFLTREIARALKEEEHQVVVLPFTMPTYKVLPDPKVYSVFLQTLINACEQYKPDALLTINHLGFDAEGRMTELLEALDLPGLIWYVDSPRYILLDFRANVSDGVGIFLWDKSYRDWMAGLGFNKIAELPLATDPELFKPATHVESQLPLLDSSALAFVGDSMTFAVEKAMQKLPPQWGKLALKDAPGCEPTEMAKRFCETMLTRSANNRQPAWEVLDEVLNGTTIPEVFEVDSSESLNQSDQIARLNLESALALLATKLQRAAFLSEISASTEVEKLFIFGDESWKQILNGTTTILPPLDYYTQLPQLYHQAGAVLNLTGFQMPYALNQRCYDVPAAGGFLLTDNQPAICEQFDPDFDMVCFSSSEELLAHWNYYSKYPDERQKRIAHTRQRILQEHTYQHRIRSMLACFHEWFRM